MKEKYIEIRGARLHNLKNINLDIPMGKLVVITGVSGSGKSSLAFDTLYAEGQRRYVESLSSYARQFLGRMDKPEVDMIHNLPPAIAIEQKVNTRNARSTVGTSTEIYDYLKILFARIGKTVSPVSGKEVTKHQVGDIVNEVFALSEKTRVLLLAPIEMADREVSAILETLLQQGFSKVVWNGEPFDISDLTKQEQLSDKTQTLELLIDRIAVKDDEDLQSRFADSVQTAFYEGKGNCIVKIFDKEKPRTLSFSDKFELDGMVFDEPSVHLFSFNNPMGFCPECEGYGKVIGIDEQLVIPNPHLSIYEEAVACWKGDTNRKYLSAFIEKTGNFPIHMPYFQLSDKEKKLLWDGEKGIKGINDFFHKKKEKLYKIQNRVLISRYSGKTICPACKGSRLKPEASFVQVAGKNISELVEMPIDRLAQFFSTISLSAYDKEVAKRLLIEINNRLSFLNDVGLGYLTLNRVSSTLSGGESQRINLATSLGSSLVGSMYVLDEPSIGLHSRDTHRLIEVLQKLRDVGNTVVVVEHDEEIMRAADYIIDIGPHAGRLGGEISFAGTLEEMQQHGKSLTAQYLFNRLKVKTPLRGKYSNDKITVEKAIENNLKGITVSFPLNQLVVVTGVSGSGKTSLVKNIFYPALAKPLGISVPYITGKHKRLSGDIHQIKWVEFVDQSPIGRSSRSNPVTYTKAYDPIRKLFAEQPAAKYQGLTASSFSFNIDGGRCDECLGDGTVTVEMQFMPDVTLVCESCNGKRFKDEVLDVTYRKKSIHDVLEMTINEAIDFFAKKDKSTEKNIVHILSTLQSVGLGYVKLGQSSSTLSGGESQRVKLATFISHKKTQPTLFIFDEPTTGLHFDDITKLLTAFSTLVEHGHSVVVIEHNKDVIINSDYVIDLGQEGGDEGGNLVYEGTVEGLKNCKNSYTGQFL